MRNPMKNLLPQRMPCLWRGLLRGVTKRIPSKRNWLFSCGMMTRRFLRHNQGAAAVEFAFVALPFLALLFMIIEVALVFLAQGSLEIAAADAGRLVLTGQAQSLDASTFKEKICARQYAMFDCNALYVDVKSYGSEFSKIDNTIQYDSGGHPKTEFSPGKVEEVAVVRLLYYWPIILPLNQPYLADSGSTNRLLVATAVFRNEP